MGVFEYRPQFYVNKAMTVKEMCILSGRTYTEIKQSIYWQNIRVLNRTKMYSAESCNKILNNPKVIQNWLIEGFVNLKTVSDTLKISPTTVKTIARKYGIYFKEQDLKHDGKIWFRTEDVPVIEKYINRDKRHFIKQGLGTEEPAIEIKPKKQETKETHEERIARLKREHPLVKDERCFQLGWFPDSVPEQFLEAENETKNAEV